MSRLVVAGTLALCIGVALALFLRVDTNPSAVFGQGAAPITALETEAGRQGAILIRADDPKLEVEIAKQAVALLDHPAIERISTGPDAGNSDVLDWLWQHRFRLSPPRIEDLEPEAMAARLTEAVDLLTSSQAMVLGDRPLRDPTGSFARLIERMDALRPELGNREGFWHSPDGGLLIFLTFEDRPLDARAMATLTASLRGLADGTSINLHLSGPRFVSTEVSAATERGASLAGGIAGVLLILWLAFALRDLRGFATVLLPLALGLGTAALSLQLIFGSVHAIALGFGGALAGLALDYPLHLAGHGRAGSRRARRLIGIGMATTVTAFLAMTGAGLEVLTQTGLFVAIGLSVAALSSMLLIARPAATRTLPLERLFWRLPGGLVTLATISAMGAAMVWQAKPMIDRPLFDLPPRVESDLKTVQSAAAIPTTRHLLRVSGETAQQVLERETQLFPVLDQAIKKGEIGGYQMAASSLPPVSSQVPDLPDAEAMSSAFEAALTVAGLQPDYADTLRKSYAAAQSAVLVEPTNWRGLAELAPLLAGLSIAGDRAEDTVLLHPPLDADRLAARLEQANLPGVTFEDLADSIWASVAELRRTAALWLGIGALCAALILAAMLRNLAGLVRILLTVGTSLALTAAVLTAVLGSLTVFQIVALTLVVGIGVDYALFLNPAARRHDRVLAARSVSLCAGSTLLAFVTMAWSDVRVMGEIGLTVSLGVLVVVVLCLGMMGHGRPLASETRD